MTDLDFNKALVFFAHPDDGEFMAGGSMIRWASEGKEIVLCVVTNGAMGSNDPEMKREDLIAARREEQLEAAKITGISDVVFLGYEDCQVEDSHELRRDIIREIRRYKPDIVIGPDPTMYFFAGAYVNHPDHRKVGEAFCAAISPGAATVPLYREDLYDKGFGPHHLKAALFGMTPQPNYWVDIEEHLDTKIKSVSVHYTQTPEFGEEFADRMRTIASVSAEGADQDIKYAEAFRVINFRER
ncbi:MAG TPA: PIG-L deacetylase family protein [Actinomycetota bacterium]|nr:PIG-L deacetylase family protein [Actinomycetota bacterium]